MLGNNDNNISMMDVTEVLICGKNDNGEDEIIVIPDVVLDDEHEMNLTIEKDEMRNWGRVVDITASRYNHVVLDFWVKAVD